MKNLWARRRRNGWLLAELILVSIISWVILDPVIVVTHDRNIPLGYDADRLCLVSLAALQPNAPGYNAEAQDSVSLVDGYLSLVRHAGSFEGVELATPLLGFCYPNSQEMEIPHIQPKVIPYPIKSCGCSSCRIRSSSRLTDSVRARGVHPDNCPIMTIRSRTSS